MRVQFFYHFSLFCFNIKNIPEIGKIHAKSMDEKVI